MVRSTKGLPSETREKLKEVADLNHKINEREKGGDDVSTLKSHREQLMKQIKEEIVENDKKQSDNEEY